MDAVGHFHLHRPSQFVMLGSGIKLLIEELIISLETNVRRL